MIFLTLLAGLLLSSTAGYYSIIGLLAIFPGAILPICLMGGTLEFAKLVSVSWLYRNWGIAPKFIKSYFIFAILILMFITSMGTFGYLSKVHLETTVSVTDNTVEISRIENEIASEQRQIDNAQRSITLLDKLVDGNDVEKAVTIRARQKTERAQLGQTIKQSSENINKLNVELAPLKKETLKKEAEIGPLKYLAELIYGEEAKNHFDSAVRFVIILIVLVFDPLAVLLLIAANISIKYKAEKKDEKIVAIPEEIRYNKKRGRPKKAAKKKSDPIDNNSIYKFVMDDEFNIKQVKRESVRGKVKKVK